MHPPQFACDELLFLGSFATEAACYASTFSSSASAASNIFWRILLISLCIWKGLGKYIKPNRFFKCLNYFSKNITQIYIIQWLLIIWMLPYFGYHELNYNKTFVKSSSGINNSSICIYSSSHHFIWEWASRVHILPRASLNKLKFCIKKLLFNDIYFNLEIYDVILKELLSLVWSWKFKLTIY